MGQPIVFLDLETTGLNPHKQDGVAAAGIIEIGAVITHHNELYELSRCGATDANLPQFHCDVNPKEVRPGKPRPGRDDR